MLVSVEPASSWESVAEAGSRTVATRATSEGSRAGDEAAAACVAVVAAAAACVVAV